MKIQIQMISLVFSLLFSSICSYGVQTEAKGNGKKAGTTLMSYNIHHGVGLDGKLSLERIAGVIRDSGAEIVGLQEVDRFFGIRSAFKDQAKELAGLLGYHYAYGANLDFDPAEGQTERPQYGTAIVSKHPILRSENILLSSFGKEQRGILHAVVNVGGIHVNVYNTHLGLDVPSRLAQAQEIIDLVSIADGPALLLGDFNAEPGSGELQLLLKSGLLTNSFHGMDDAHTFPVRNPSTIIDYILTSPSLGHGNQRVVQTEASDHLPIVTDVVFKGKD